MDISFPFIFLKQLLLEKRNLHRCLLAMPETLPTWPGAPGSIIPTPVYFPCVPVPGMEEARREARRCGTRSSAEAERHNGSCTCTFVVAQTLGEPEKCCKQTMLAFLTVSGAALVPFGDCSHLRGPCSVMSQHRLERQVLGLFRSLYLHIRVPACEYWLWFLIPASCQSRSWEMAVRVPAAYRRDLDGVPGT